MLLDLPYAMQSLPSFKNVLNQSLFEIFNTLKNLMCLFKAM